MAPVSWNGSQILYRRVVRPFFLKHEAAVDGMVSNMGGKAMTVAENATREGMTAVLNQYAFKDFSQREYKFKDATWG